MLQLLLENSREWCSQVWVLTPKTLPPPSATVTTITEVSMYHDCHVDIKIYRGEFAFGGMKDMKICQI